MEADSLTLARAALTLVLPDLESLAVDAAGFDVVEVDGDLIVRNQGAIHGSLYEVGSDSQEMHVAVADAVQGLVTYNVGDPVWPTCNLHGFGLHPDIVDGRGVWTCRPGRHEVASIGELNQLQLRRGR